MFVSKKRNAKQSNGPIDLPLTPQPQWIPWLCVLVIWVAGFLAYSNSFSIAFQFDDTHTVQSNMYVRSLKYIPQYFLDAKTYSYRPENSGYRPMTTVALALGFALSQMNTWGYHLIKLLEHCLLATMIFVVARRLLPRGDSVDRMSPYARTLVAFFGGLVFVVHRANTETVDYICAVSTLQAGLFHFLAFYLYLKRREDLKKPIFRAAAIVGSLLLYMGSMLSKEEGITLVAMIGIYEWFYSRELNEGYFEALKRNIKKIVLAILPYLVVAALYAYLRATMQDAISDSSRGNTPLFIYFITQFRSWLHYWTLFFWPVTLNADNLAFDFSPGLEDPRIWGAFLVHAGVWFWAWKQRFKQPFVSYAIAWIYITVLPASSIFVLVEAVNEHRMYIPYIFLSMLSVWGAFKLSSHFLKNPQKALRVATGMLAVCVVLLGIGAHARNEVWQTEVSLWEDVYAKNPQSPRAMNVLGVSLMNSGEFNRSVQMLENCHRISPQYLPCMVHLSMGYAQHRQYDKGLAVLRKGNQLNPDYPHINFHLGMYYKDYFGDLENAKRHLMRCIQATQGRFFQATVKLGEIALEQGGFQEAMNIANSILQVDATNGEAWEILAKGYMLSGDMNNAKGIFEKLFSSAPQAAKYALDLANILERQGDLQRSAGFYKRVLEINPTAIQAWQAIIRLGTKFGDLEAVRQGNEKVAELKASGQWTFFVSSFLIGEKPGMIRPI